MTQEEKAKAYDKVRKKIAIRFGSNVADEIFSQYEESEDERVRKNMIIWLKGFIGEASGVGYTEEEIRERIAWLERQGNLVKYYEDKLDRCACDNFNKGYKKALEKQGKQKLTPIFRIGDTIIAKDGTYIEKEPFHIDRIEDDCYWDGDNTILVCNQDEFEIFEQKPADKVEPKFHEGEWLVHNDLVGVTFCITQIHAPHYYLTNNNSFIKFGEEDNYRPWTIQDAKDGDVLAFDNETMVIFKDLYNATTFHSYCHIEDGVFTASEKDIPDWWEGKGFQPATKEQRDTLEKAMADAGYTFDFENKELKKIEQKPAWSEEEHCIINGIIGYLCTHDSCELEGFDKWYDFLKSLKYRCLPQQQEWSEEDEEIHRKCICAMRASACGFPEEEKFVEQVDNWLKSLKDRVQPQPKQEWSEEDEKMLSDIEDCIKNLPIFYESLNINGEDKTTERFVCDAINWLKFLKERVQPQPKQE